MSDRKELPTVEEKCETCKFWDRNELTNPRDDYIPDRGQWTGACRKRAPVVAVNCLAPDDGDPDGYWDAHDIRTCSVWPETGVDEWCGDWKPKPAAG